MAAEYVTKCVFDHSKEALGDCIPFPKIGENLFVTSDKQSAFDALEAIRGWYGEKADYNYNTAACNSGKMCWKSIGPNRL